MLNRLQGFTKDFGLGGVELCFVGHPLGIYLEVTIWIPAHVAIIFLMIYITQIGV